MSLIYATVFVWVSVPAFILSLLFQPTVLSSDLKFTASAQMHVQMECMMPADIRRKLHSTYYCPTQNTLEQGLSTVG